MSELQRYKEGVWFDTEYGSFVTLFEDRDADEIVICDTDEDELDRIEMVDFTASDFYPVSDSAIENPTAVLEDYLNRVGSGFYNEHSNTGTTFREELSVRYAMKQTTITENDDGP